MKYILISLFLILSLYGDEIQRIESIVKDITKLRVDYEECRKQLRDKEITKMGAEISSNDEIIKLATTLVKEYNLSHNMKMMDAIIASTVMVYSIKLMSLNRKDFKYLEGVELL